MSYVIDRFRRQQQYIDFGGIENTPPLFSGEGEVIVPSGERVTGESPIQANNKVENENKCGSEMDKPYPTEPIVSFGWCGMLYSGWVADNVSGNAQYDDSCCVDPMEYAYGEFPHVDFT